MRSLFRYDFISIVFGCLVFTTTAQAQLNLGALLGDNQHSNNNNPNIPLIGALGLGSNNNQQTPFNSNQNQYSNNYPNNNDASRSLLSALGGEANVNRPITNSLNNFNRYPNTGQTNQNNNVNNIKDQMKEAEKLLERLKELNRLKEQKKLETEKESQGQAGTSDNPKIDNSDNKNNIINDDHRKTGVLKSLTKKKFYFMVMPVVPENEAVKYEQTVYYEK